MPIPEELMRFKKMLNFGVPPIGVRNKMIQEGYTQEDFDQYINPETAIEDEEEEENDVEDEEESQNEDDEEESERNEDEEKKPEEDNNIKSSDTSDKHIKYNFVPEVDDEEIKMNNLQPIPIKKALLIVNTFIVNTTSFLNKFVSHCETKLHEIHTNTQKLETSLMLLEGKLSSVKWLESAQKGEIKNPTMPKTTPGENNDNNNKDENKENDGDDNENSEENNENEETNNANTGDELRNDPDLQPWFKMLKVKVPEQAVRNKMSQSGVDDDTIEKVIELARE